MIDRITGEC